MTNRLSLFDNEEMRQLRLELARGQIEKSTCPQANPVSGCAIICKVTCKPCIVAVYTEGSIFEVRHNWINCPGAQKDPILRFDAKSPFALGPEAENWKDLDPKIFQEWPAKGIVRAQVIVNRVLENLDPDERLELVEFIEGGAYDLFSAVLNHRFKQLNPGNTKE